MAVKNVSFSFKYLLYIAVGLLIVLISFNSWYKVDEGERGIQLRNGRVVGVAEPGLHFKIPLVDSVETISVRTHTLSLDKLEAYSSDQQPASMRVSVTWNVPPEEVARVYTKHDTLKNLGHNVVLPRTLDTVKNVFGRFSAQNAIQRRETLGIEVTQALRQALSTEPGIQLQSVQIEEVGFSQEYERSIEARMKAEVQIQTMRQNLETEKVNAEILITRAQAQADSRLAEATAEAKAIELKGLADARAIQAKTDAISANPNIVNLTAVEKWNGELPSTMPPGATLPFINIK